MNDALKCAMIAGLYACSVIEQLHPGAAMGTSFGCFCFLGFRDPTAGPMLAKLFRKFFLLIFSWGVGYGFGYAVSTTENWAGWAMIAAVGAAAFAAVIAGAFNLMFGNNGPLPEWLTGILDRIPVLRKGNDESQ